MPHPKGIQKILDRAQAGKITRDRALAEIKALQDTAYTALAEADDAFYVSDEHAHLEVVGASIFDPTALIVREAGGRELYLPFNIEQRGSGAVVVWRPLKVAPVYVPISERAAASKRTDRAAITTQARDHAEAAGPTDPFHVQLEDAESGRKRRLADAARRGAPTVSRNVDGSMNVSVPTDAQIAVAKARSRASLDRARAAKVDKWGDPT